MLMNSVSHYGQESARDVRRKERAEGKGLGKQFQDLRKMLLGGGGI